MRERDVPSHPRCRCRYCPRIGGLAVKQPVARTRIDDDRPVLLQLRLHQPERGCAWPRRDVAICTTEQPKRRSFQPSERRSRVVTTPFDRCELLCNLLLGGARPSAFLATGESLVLVDNAVPKNPRAGEGDEGDVPRVNSRLRSNPPG